MKLTVLIDNNTLIDRYFLGEPGLSFYIEENNKKILFDVGYSNAFLINAQKMNIPLTDIDSVILSHGHLDHTWGLDALIRLNLESKIESVPYKQPELLAHPRVFDTKTIGGLGEIGMALSEEKASRHFDIQLSENPVWISDKLVYLGEIERKNNFEAKQPIGDVIIDKENKPDLIFDDTALAYKSAKGLVVITGCSHAGICNIVEYAKKVCGMDRVIDIIGGLHLLDPSKEQLQGTLDYFRQLRPGEVHACHCTDIQSKIALAHVTNLKEVGVGLRIEYN